LVCHRSTTPSHVKHQARTKLLAKIHPRDRELRLPANVCWMRVCLKSLQSKFFWRAAKSKNPIAIRQLSSHVTMTWEKFSSSLQRSNSYPWCRDLSITKLHHKVAPQLRPTQQLLQIGLYQGKQRPLSKGNRWSPR
jgi:hypothetical protein